jgi:hypothetical protein
MRLPSQRSIPCHCGLLRLRTQQCRLQQQPLQQGQARPWRPPSLLAGAPVPSRLPQQMSRLCLLL